MVEASLSTTHKR